ncbi:MAG TPA: HAD family hydrolase, partial [Dehalococcoidia bacterium]|nr:HAD family hydrolase [Dehalococcoidia bacterium]
MSDEIKAVTFDCYGTLVDFGDESFARAYGQICGEQGIPLDGHVFYDKWMEVWRRLAQDGQSSDGGSIGVVQGMAANTPGPLSEAETIPPHPDHHTPSAGRNRSLDGPMPPFRPYREEWPEHFAICFEELGVKGDPFRAHMRLVELIAEGPAFPETQRAVEAVRRRRPVALLSNADDDFLVPCLKHNGLS